MTEAAGTATNCEASNYIIFLRVCSPVTVTVHASSSVMWMCPCNATHHCAWINQPSVRDMRCNIFHCNVDAWNLGELGEEKKSAAFEVATRRIANPCYVILLGPRQLTTRRWRITSVIFFLWYWIYSPGRLYKIKRISISIYIYIYYIYIW